MFCSLYKLIIDVEKRVSVFAHLVYCTGAGLHNLVTVTNRALPRVITAMWCNMWYDKMQWCLCLERNFRFSFGSESLWCRETAKRSQCEVKLRWMRVILLILPYTIILKSVCIIPWCTGWETRQRRVHIKHQWTQSRCGDSSSSSSVGRSPTSKWRLSHLELLEQVFHILLLFSIFFFFGAFP